MKTLIKLFFILAIIIPSTTMAQSNMDKLYKKYATAEGFSAVRFTPEIFAMIAKASLDTLMTGSEKEVIMNQLSSIKSIRILTYKATQANPLDFNEIIEKNFPPKEYKLAFEAIEQGSSFEVRVRNLNDLNLEEIIMIAKDKGSTTLINIDGIIEMANLKKLIAAYNQKSSTLKLLSK